ncbi:MAG: cytochrome c, partial [Verrucomicrobia bacterium]|nr:cytochrome c [Verrucomicrobiota bacterium]
MPFRSNKLSKYFAFGIVLILPPTLSLAAVAAQHPGAAIYQKLCMECHGKNGGGVAGKYDESLAGDRSLEALAHKIEKTMPEDNEGA